MRKIIIIALLGIVLAGCGHNQPKPTVQYCPVPPELQLVPQGDLTLPAPSSKLVKPKDGEAYFVLTQDDFYLWLDNNKQLEEYIRDCRKRVELVREYYESGN